MSIAGLRTSPSRIPIKFNRLFKKRNYINTLVRHDGKKRAKVDVGGSADWGCRCNTVPCIQPCVKVTRVVVVVINGNSSSK